MADVQKTTHRCMCRDCGPVGCGYDGDGHCHTCAETTTDECPRCHGTGLDKSVPPGPCWICQPLTTRKQRQRAEAHAMTVQKTTESQVDNRKAHIIRLLICFLLISLTWVALDAARLIGHLEACR